MAFGDLKGGTGFTGAANSITNPFSVTGSIAVNAGDLIYAVIAQQTALTVTACADNLGNTYSATNAGTLSGIISGRAFYSRVSVAGTLTSVSFTTTASANNVAAVVAVFEGPFDSSPLDANPANLADITSPFSGNPTGTLTQAAEIVVTWAAESNGLTWAATSPNLLGPQIVSQALASARIGYQTVSSTTTVTPAFTGTNPTNAVLGTNSFKQDLYLIKPNPLIYLPPSSAWLLPGSLYRRNTLRSNEQSQARYIGEEEGEEIYLAREPFFLRRKPLWRNHVNNSFSAPIVEPVLPEINAQLDVQVGGFSSNIQATVAAEAALSLPREPFYLRRLEVQRDRPSLSVSTPLSTIEIIPGALNVELNQVIDNFARDLWAYIEAEAWYTTREPTRLRRFVVYTGRQPLYSSQLILEEGAHDLVLNKVINNLTSDFWVTVESGEIVPVTREPVRLRRLEIYKGRQPLYSSQLILEDAALNLELNRPIGNVTGDLWATVESDEVALVTREPVRLRRLVVYKGRQPIYSSQLIIEDAALDLELNKIISNVTGNLQVTVASDEAIPVLRNPVRLRRLEIYKGRQPIYSSQLIIEDTSAFLLDKLIGNFARNLQATVEVGTTLTIRDPVRLHRRPLWTHRKSLRVSVPGESEPIIFEGNSPLTIAVGKTQPRRRNLSVSTPLSTTAIVSPNFALNQLINNFTGDLEATVEVEVVFTVRDPVRLRHRPLWTDRRSFRVSVSGAAEEILFIGNNILTAAIERALPRRRNVSVSAPVITIAGVGDFVLSKTLNNITLNAQSQVVVNAALSDLINNIISNADIDVLNNLRLDRALNNLTLNSVLFSGIGFALGKTIDNVTTNAQAKVSDNLALNQFIGAITSNLQAVNEDHLSLNKTINNITLNATATQGIFSNVVVDKVINNITSVGTLTATFVDLNAVVNQTIAPITLFGRARRRVAGDDANVAWWWRQYVQRYAEEKKRERVFEGELVSPVGKGYGRLEVVEVEEVKVQAVIRPRRIKSDITTPRPLCIGKAIHGVERSVGITLRGGVVSGKINIGTYGKINQPLIPASATLRASARQINFLGGHYTTAMPRVSIVACNGHIINAKISAPAAVIKSNSYTGLVVQGKIRTPGAIISNTGFVGVVGRGAIVSPIPIASAMGQSGIVGTGLINVSITAKINGAFIRGNGVAGQIITPAWVIKKITILSGVNGEAKLNTPLAIAPAVLINGSIAMGKINLPCAQVKSRLTAKKPLTLITGGKIFGPNAVASAKAEHDPDDEEALTASLLLAA